MTTLEENAEYWESFPESFRQFLEIFITPKGVEKTPKQIYAEAVVLEAIVQRVAWAREKHPVFAEGAFHALGIIKDEFEELEHAVEHESRERQVDEALDVIATCVRFILGEHLKGGEK